MSSKSETIVCREFEAADLEACVAIFESLTPQYFKAGELPEFKAFLRNLDQDRCRFSVIETEEAGIIACGGMWIDREKGVASLCWEMVHREHQRQGIGGFMLEARMGWLGEYPELSHVIASASGRSAGFFQKKGFETYHVQKDYFASGVDLYDMKKRLD